MSHGTDPKPDYTIGQLRARTATMLMFALPGSCYVYQGEELGLREVADIPFEKLQDPVWTTSGNLFKGRDGCRVPLPWGTTRYFGFSEVEPHLPMPEWFKNYTVELENKDRSSFFNFYRTTIALRKN